MQSKKSIFNKTLWAEKIQRVRGPFESRFNKIRLDKNEKPDNHLSKLIKDIKKNIKHEHLTAYPETENFTILYLKNSKSKKRQLFLHQVLMQLLKIVWISLQKRMTKLFLLIQHLQWWTCTLKLKELNKLR